MLHEERRGQGPAQSERSLSVGFHFLKVLLQLCCVHMILCQKVRRHTLHLRNAGLQLISVLGSELRSDQPECVSFLFGKGLARQSPRNGFLRDAPLEHFQKALPLDLWHRFHVHGHLPRLLLVHAPLFQKRAVVVANRSHAHAAAAENPKATLVVIVISGAHKLLMDGLVHASGTLTHAKVLRHIGSRPGKDLLNMRGIQDQVGSVQDRTRH
mmetsp:Transcript_17744/g.42173  ORF Transcript_17744/g.42173 Transcript_17744/m.42173 type:complete len:212 (+) Transcript_17744:118-753(+)